MLFETSDGQISLILEHDSQTGLHERTVLVNALGLLTSAQQDDHVARSLSANLGFYLGELDINLPEDSKTGKDKASFKNTEPYPVTIAEIKIIAQALEEYIKDTGRALSCLATTPDPFKCNLRVLQSDEAQSMLDNVTEEFAIIRDSFKPKSTFGFH